MAEEEKKPCFKVNITEGMAVLKQQGFRMSRARFADKSISDYLAEIEPKELADKYVAFHAAHSYYDTVCAGAKHHHWWRSGMADHVREMIGVSLDIYQLYSGDLQGRITPSDIIIACYLHDFAKVWTYEEITDEDRERAPKKYLEQQLFKPYNGAFDIIDEESKTLLELSKFSITPSETQWSAVLFAEGGYADANFRIGGLTRTADTVMSRNPLAVLTHIADMYSSQVLGGSIA
jgi:hypothetical protein